jgi:hypothetical protein
MRNYENMNELFYGYIERMKALNELYAESLRNFIRFNNQCRELFKGNTNTLYKEYVEHFQKLNKQWAESLWNPSLLMNRSSTDGEYDIPELIDELRTNYPGIIKLKYRTYELQIRCRSSHISGLAAST